jgi:cation diffusion facilitator CzcD-associated flavoprotein CzcO
VAGHGPFKGQIVHPQTWPEDLDYTGKRVVVIGSGATAATLVPAIAGAKCARHDAAALADLFHPGRNAIELADTLRELEIDETWIHEIVRRKILHDQAFTRRAFERARSGQAGAARRRPRHVGPERRRRHRTSRRATGPGSSASPSSPTATSSRRSALRQGRRSSPTRSSASPRPASC